MEARRLRLAAAVVVVVGWFVAAVIFALAPPDGERGIDGYRVVGGQAFASDDASSRELWQLERLGGKAAVLTFKFNRWLTSLWSGRPLAYTLAVVSLLVALGCLRVAGLMMEMTSSPSGVPTPAKNASESSSSSGLTHEQVAAKDGA